MRRNITKLFTFSKRLHISRFRIIFQLVIDALSMANTATPTTSLNLPSCPLDIWRLALNAIGKEIYSHWKVPICLHILQGLFVPLLILHRLVSSRNNFTTLKDEDSFSSGLNTQSLRNGGASWDFMFLALTHHYLRRADSHYTARTTRNNGWGGWRGQWNHSVSLFSSRFDFRISFQTSTNSMLDYVVCCASSPLLASEQ